MMDNYYTTAIEGMPTLLDCCDGDVMNSFNRKKYVDSFKTAYQRYVNLFDAVETGYNTVIDKDQFLTNMAEALGDRAEEMVDSCKRKAKKDQMMMDLNLTMAVFVLPMITEFRGESSEPLNNKLIEVWKEKFPKSSLQASDYETIEAGFHRKWCYITTAACETLGLPDDCSELNLLRDYRDTYLMESPGGKELIEEYYDIAPSIVKHIGQQSDAEEIYRGIWNDWVQPCIEMIKNNEPEACREHYTEMVHTMQSRYFHVSRKDLGGAA